MSTQPGKDTIYIDVDDEITAIIDKVRGSHEKIVALVLPKRATVLQSIVNMKLLKRTADDAKKHLVLITAEAGLMPLAGSVGMYVAKTLQSKPEIPAHASQAEDSHADHEESVSMADDLDPNASVGEHARRAPASVVRPTALAGAFEEEADSAIELDNSASTPVVGGAAAAKSGKPRKDKKFNIPDFNKFRVWGVIAGVAVVVLIFMSYMSMVVLPRASVLIKTDSTALRETLDLRLSTTAKQVDVENGMVPAVAQSVVKTATQQGEATGQVDKGTKATGQVTLALKDCSQDQVTIPAGSGLSAGGNTYITQQPATLTSVKIGPQCRNSDFPAYSTKTVSVIAQNNGDKYNAAATTYSVVNYSNVVGNGSAMSGGTSEIVKVVSQADIDAVKAKIAAQDTATIKKELQQGLTAKGLYAIDGSFANAEPEVTTSVAVGAEAPSVTVTQKTTYTMMGVQQADLKKLVEAAVSDKIDKSKQQILDYGLSKAVFKLQNSQATSTLTTMEVTAIAGSDLKIDEIRKQVAGKKSNDAKEVISAYPGVTEVTVDYSPFWVSAIPKNTSKITVTVEKPVVKNAN